SPAHRKAHAEAGTRSMLVTALRYAGRVVGTLAFYYRDPRQFTEAEKNAASLLGNLAAAAIGTAELYETQQRLAEDHRFIAEASEQLALSLEYERTLANVAALAVRAARGTGPGARHDHVRLGRDRPAIRRDRPCGRAGPRAPRRDVGLQRAPVPRDTGRPPRRPGLPRGRRRRLRRRPRRPRVHGYEPPLRARERRSRHHQRARSGRALRPNAARRARRRCRRKDRAAPSACARHRRADPRPAGRGPLRGGPERIA